MVFWLSILHGLIAVALLGAITHQALAISRDATRRNFVARFRAVDGPSYADAVVVLFIITLVMGAVLYPDFRLVVRPFLEAQDRRADNGIFEMKEHFAALGLLLLPAYWASWKSDAARDRGFARRAITLVLAGFVWWDFLAGHVLTAVKGLGG